MSTKSANASLTAYLAARAPICSSTVRCQLGDSGEAAGPRVTASLTAWSASRPTGLLESCGDVIQESFNLIGGIGAGEGNTIAFNAGSGVLVSAGAAMPCLATPSSPMLALALTPELRA